MEGVLPLLSINDVRKVQLNMQEEGEARAGYNRSGWDVVVGKEEDPVGLHCSA